MPWLLGALIGFLIGRLTASPHEPKPYLDGHADRAGEHDVEDLADIPDPAGVVYLADRRP